MQLTCFVSDYGFKMANHDSGLTDHFECSNALFVIPPSDDSMKEDAIAFEGSTVEWVMADLVKTAQIL